MKRRHVILIVAACIFGAVPASAAAADDGGAAKTVAAFYDWYLAHDGRLEKAWDRVEKLYDPDLYNLVAETYVKDNFSSQPFSAETCGERLPQCKVVAFDPFSNAQSPATSYTIGPTQIDGDKATVDVTPQLSGTDHRTSQISVILQRSGGAFVITDLRYAETRYYYGSAIDDLKKYLADYNC